MKLANVGLSEVTKGRRLNNTVLIGVRHEAVAEIEEKILKKGQNTIRIIESIKKRATGKRLSSDEIRFRAYANNQSSQNSSFYVVTSTKSSRCHPRFHLQPHCRPTDY